MQSLRHEIHARHIAFLDRMKAKAVSASSAEVAKPVEPEKTFSMDLQTLNQYRSPWRVAALEICKKHGVTWAQIIEQNRLPRIVLARQEICWHLHKHFKFSYPKIGRCINRDHTSTLYGARRHQKRLEEKKNGRKKVRS